MSKITASVVLDSYAENPWRRLTTFLPRLKTLVDYDPESGLFVWKHHRYKRFIGTVAGQANTKGALQINIDGKLYLAHRLAWVYMTGRWPTKPVDHKDRNKKNNKWTNLREATNGQNRANSKSNSVLGLKGVYKQTKGERFYSVIRVDNKAIYLGTFDTAFEAALAYKTAAIKHHGEFARTEI